MEGIFPSNMGGNMNAVKADVEKSRIEKVREIGWHYGYDAQSRQCIEEMAELTQAINKYWRKCGNGQSTDKSEKECLSNLIEEIADVQIMLEQMKFFLSAGHEVNKIIDEKLDRQIERIKTENV